MEVIIGTYEEMVVGYRLTEENGSFTLEQSFTNHSHSRSVRGIAVSTNNFLATGGQDETINLFDLKNRVEYGSLTEQEGGISALEFFENSFLLSASEDGTICVWKTGNWQLLKTLRGHKKAVTAISVHPSGKLLLSLSKDMTLRTWNLVKGRSAYITNLKTAGDIVKWSPNGNLYIVVLHNKVDVYNTTVAGVVHSIDFGKPVLAVAFITNEYIAVSGEGGQIEIHSTEKEAVICVFQAHEKRVKGLSCVPWPDDTEDKLCLVTGSSDGFVKIWSLQLKELSNEPECIAKVETGCRITCITVSQQVQGKSEEETENITQKEISRKRQTTETESSPKKKKKKEKRVTIVTQ